MLGGLRRLSIRLLIFGSGHDLTVVRARLVMGSHWAWRLVKILPPPAPPLPHSRARARARVCVCVCIRSLALSTKRKKEKIRMKLFHVQYLPQDVLLLFLRCCYS